MEHKIDEKKQGGYYLKQFVVVGGDLRCHYLVLYLKEQLKSQMEIACVQVAWCNQ